MELDNFADNSGDKTDRAQVAAGLKRLVSLGLGKEGGINLDWGGGRYDIGSKYLESAGITNLVYDPFKRSEEHNESVLKACKEMKGADSGTICNVLNVIPNKPDRIKAIKEVLSHLKYKAHLVIQVYEKNKHGVMEKTRDGYQLNQPLAFYKTELEEAGYSVTKKQDVLIIQK